MATAKTTLPPMGKISMIGIWVETVLYGMSSAPCTGYTCSFSSAEARKLLGVGRGLLVMSTMLFLLATIHVGVSLQQLLDAFVYAPDDVPNYSTTYWLDYTTTPCVVKNNVYDTLLLAYCLILIWRLYVVFMRDWRVVVFPLILTIAGVGSIYAASAAFTLPNNGLYGSVTTSLIISGWVVGFILNVSVTGAIVARLWWTSRTIALLTTTSTNRFASSIYVVVESGAISLVACGCLLALFASKSPGALTGLDIDSQLVVLTQLLILVQVQVGQTSHYRISSDLTATAGLDEITFRGGILQDSQQDIPLRTTHVPCSPSSEHGSHA
ncbi:hypothetical protein HD554DRAFT_1783791 [Boletus coccyginus]|nr:hypothetical protein HD554DRAFT_1783791 [Boletus coccyginus]